MQKLQLDQCKDECLFLILLLGGAVYTLRYLCLLTRLRHVQGV